MAIKLRTIMAMVLVFSFLVSSDLLAGNKAKERIHTPPEISQLIKNDLIQLREEEKLARDVYLYLYAQWDQWIFSNIAKSEQQHMDAV